MQIHSTQVKYKRIESQQPLNQNYTARQPQCTSAADIEQIKV